MAFKGVVFGRGIPGKSENGFSHVNSTLLVRQICFWFGKEGGFLFEIRSGIRRKGLLKILSYSDICGVCFIQCNFGFANIILFFGSFF